MQQDLYATFYAAAFRACAYALFLQQRVNGDVSSLLQTPSRRLTLRIYTTSCSGGRGFLRPLTLAKCNCGACPELYQEGAGRVDRFPSPPPAFQLPEPTIVRLLLLDLM